MTASRRLARGIVITVAAATVLLGLADAAHAAPGDNGPLAAPSLEKPQFGESTAQSVTLHWIDRSDNEQGFRLYRLTVHGTWVLVADVATHNMAGITEYYSVKDTDTSMSAQCYQVKAYNAGNTSASGLQCTVRPDPVRFPQYLTSSATQWRGLTSISGGTGELRNPGLYSSNLVYSERVFGVNLDWHEDGTSVWTVQGQAGPEVMWGEAVALRVLGGGWLRYGTQTWGVDLQLSDTPVYEWYILGGQPGQPMGGTDFALWNRAASGYLVWAQQSYGVNLGI
jgi:hypothetical protein